MANSEPNICIVKLPEGNDVIGVYSREGLYGRLDSAAVIRVWGTKRDRDGGLGWLAREGPRPETVLDSLPHGCTFMEPVVIMRIHCDPIKWKKVLGLADE